MLAMAVRNTKKLVRARARTDGSRTSRFFTREGNAAALFEDFAPPAACLACGRMEVLDPGAGTGILSAAAVEAICRAGGIREIALVAYETDPAYLPLLRDTLERLRVRARRGFKVRLSYTVSEQNFVLDEPQTDGGAGFDLIVMHPPAELLPRGSAESAAFSEIGGIAVPAAQPFVLRALSRLKPGGLLLAQLPSELLSTPSYRRIRAALLSRGVIDRIWLFTRRKGGNLELRRQVLLSLVARQSRPREPISLLVTAGDEVGEDTQRLPALPAAAVTRGDGVPFAVPRSPEELRVYASLACLPYTFESAGLCVRTGLTVEAKYSACLRTAPMRGTVPLLLPAALRGGRVEFPLVGRKQYLLPPSDALTRPNKNLLLIRRVPAKREKRRLCCAVYLAAQLPGCPRISTGNKLMTVDCRADDRQIDAKMLHGLYALLTSDLYDMYFRVVSAAGQISAADLRALPLPEPSVIRSLGERLMMQPQADIAVCNTLVAATLGQLSGFEFLRDWVRRRRVSG